MTVRLLRDPVHVVWGLLGCKVSDDIWGRGTPREGLGKVMLLHLLMDPGHSQPPGSKGGT